MAGAADLSVPLIRAYQNRRRAKIKKKFEEIRRRAEAEASPDLTGKGRKDPASG